MKPFRFVHAADLHLDSPFKGIREITPKIAEDLKEATFKAFENIVDLCIDREADFLLIAGDVFDGTDRSLRAQIRFRDQLIRLGQVGIPSYIINGNHDPRDSWLDKLTWPEQAHFFGSRQVERKVVQWGTDTLAAIYGTSYEHREMRQNLARSYRRETGDPFAIGLLHGNVGGNPNHEAYAPCSLEDLQESGMDYWALGHIHKRAVLQEADPVVVYTGNPQGRDPGEGGAHGCIVVDVDSEGRPNLEFVPTDQVRWASGQVSIDALEGEEDLTDTLEEQCLELLDAAEGRAIICRLEIIGRGHLHRRLRQGGVDEFLEATRDALAGWKPFIWVDRIEDRTRAAIDLAARAKGEDFVGDFLRMARDFREDPERLAQLRAQLAPLYGHRLGRKLLEMPDGQTLLAMLEEAQSRCLDLMITEDD